MADERLPSTGPIDLSESVAGEEDPGAAIDLALRPSAAAATDPSGIRAAGPTLPMAPGDEAPPGTPGTGEDICRACGGSGQLNGGPCPECEGTGKVVRGIGGA
ncbi:hypothetical protein PE066_01970 [Ramlibacter tataouinensis]|uniref:hypothetical protein n=1 Tax=Ramlibacter tataouinensis TaxID=94132 RepID=UPI0022F3BBDF|nr:hypothetical protein [Ramlibacter tataouinensis]WBY02321.1 hypothetical protein PE066_01970 [Ramlibacter tataouinensis]